MLRGLLRLRDNRITTLRYFSAEKTLEKLPTANYKILDTRELPSDDFVDYQKGEEPSVLDTCQEDISHVGPYLKPAFNFAAYVNKSETLKALVKLGVELYKLEKNSAVPPYLLQLDFERDIKNHVLFLHDLGLETVDIAELITKNPFIFKESLEDLHVRVSYLKSKRFDDAMITRIVQKNAQWLSYPTQEIDKILGVFQKRFKLTGHQVRLLATKKPKLITYSDKKIQVSKFAFKEEMGFSDDAVRRILLHTPALFIKDQKFVLKTFEYLHKEMNIPLETILRVPEVLTCREFRLKERHTFLKKLGKEQFDPKLPNYISPLTLVSGSDAHFATNIAGSSIQTFNAFLKAM